MLAKTYQFVDGICCFCSPPKIHAEQIITLFVDELLGTDWEDVIHLLVNRALQTFAKC
jgi:hypothetical protein